MRDPQCTCAIFRFSVVATLASRSRTFHHRAFIDYRLKAPVPKGDDELTVIIRFLIPTEFWCAIISRVFELTEK